MRWRRFAILFVPAMAAAAVLVALTTEGVLAASISVSGSAFEVASSQLKGTGFEQFGGAVTDSKGNQHPVAISAISPPLWRTSARASAWPGDPAAHRGRRGESGHGQQPDRLNSDHLSGDATFSNIVIGQDAGTLSEDPGSAVRHRAAGRLGHLDNLHQNTWLTTAGTFTLPGFDLSFGNACY